MGAPEFRKINRNPAHLKKLLQKIFSCLGFEQSAIGLLHYPILRHQSNKNDMEEKVRSIVLVCVNRILATKNQMLYKCPSFALGSI